MKLTGKTIAAIAAIVAVGVYMRWSTKPAVAGFRLGREMERRRRIRTT